MNKGLMKLTGQVSFITELTTFPRKDCQYSD